MIAAEHHRVKCKAFMLNFIYISSATQTQKDRSTTYPT